MSQSFGPPLHSSSLDLEPQTQLVAIRFVRGPLVGGSWGRASARPRYWLHAVLFLATVFTTLVVGAQLENDFAGNLLPFSGDFFRVGWIAQQPSRLLLGIPFSFTLMIILLAHEMGHYMACKRYRVNASLPYFLPAPTLIGTLGAFIRIRSPIQSRKALFDIGVAGPIAGFLLALPALAIGMSFSKVAPELMQAADIQLGYPLIFHWFRIFVPSLRDASTASIYFHPVAIAAWVGMFATSLNLLPGGQLDGGHILYALSPGAHRNCSRLLVFVLVVLGLLLWPGWLLWAAVLLGFGRRHPYVPRLPALDSKRRSLAVFASLMFALSFSPAPIGGVAIDWRVLFSWTQGLLHRM